MPNWCSNQLHIKGNRIDIKIIKETAKPQPDEYNVNEVFCMHKFIPSPDIIYDGQSLSKTKKNENIKRYGSIDGYNWNIKNWGTKWEVCESELIEQNNNNLTYAYKTAWSPNIEFIKTLSKIFPKLYFNLKFILEEEQEIEYEIDIKNGEESEERTNPTTDYLDLG